MKIMILVCVGSNGHWSATSWGVDGKPLTTASIETMKDVTVEGVAADHYHYVWVEADVPLPEEKAVTGAVVAVEKSED